MNSARANVLSSPTIRKAISILGFATILLAVIWRIANAINQNEFLESVRELQFAIDTSPDSLQRDLRISLALFLGALSLWSRRGAKTALVTALVLFLGIECITWLAMSRSPFDKTELEYHLVAGGLIAIGAILWVRGTNYLVIAMIAPAYIIIEGIVWYGSTIRMRDLLGVDRLQAPTIINNLFFGAHWWHLVVMGFSVFMILYETGAVWMENSRQTYPSQETNGQCL